MGVLARMVAVAFALAGCYAPSVHDCTVSCEAPGDCASDQICGADGWCAAPEIAGRCRMGIDAGVRDDAPSRDAAADAVTTVALRVQVMGKGSVFIEGTGVCSSKEPQRGDCMYNIAAGVQQTVHAIVTDSSEPFAMWTSMTCAGQGARCVFTPATATTIAARFAHP
jgi:hypothetical protein